MNTRACLRSVIIALALAAAAAAWSDDRPERATVTINCGGLSVELQAAYAWNLQRLSWQGVDVCPPTGAFGALLCVPAAGGWVGGMHTAGGVEQVVSATLTVDGEVADLVDGAVYSCERAELTKVSMLDHVRLEAQLVLEEGWLAQRQVLTAAEDVVVSVIYPVMFPVSAETTQWMAVTTSGEELSGEFTGEGGLEWHEDWLWTAAFIPAQRIGFLLRHLPVPEGEQVLTGYWDHERYHKLYVKVEPPDGPWREGDRVEATVAVTCFQAAPATWQETARKVAAGLVPP